MRNVYPTLSVSDVPMLLGGRRLLLPINAVALVGEDDLRRLA